MYQTTITEKEAGQRFDKYLHRILPEAGNSFLYKMLRKKNITLNDRKADGSEKIAAGDSVKIYFAEETLLKFRGLAETAGADDESADTGLSRRQNRTADYLTAYRTISGVRIIYENPHILLADKPAGVLSQKAAQTDLSLNEWLIGYLLESGSVTEEALSMFKPSICNRLDRNTSGIVLCAKSLPGAQMLGELLKNRMLHKYYQTYVKGTVQEEQLVEGYLSKDEKHNKVSVLPAETGRLYEGGKPFARQAPDEGSSYIKTAYRPLERMQDKTLLEVELITGKPHQIRAHLASIGHPLLGDYKYGDKAWNEAYRKKYHVKAQLLHAYKVVFPRLDAPFEDISGRTFYAKLPEIFYQVRA